MVFADYLYRKQYEWGEHVKLRFVIILIIVLTLLIVASILYNAKFSSFGEKNIMQNKLDNFVDLFDNDSETKEQESTNNEQYFFNKPVDNSGEIFIKVFKERRVLELYVNNEITGRFKIGLGNKPIGHKRVEGDRKTPEGSYYVCTKHDKTLFTYFLGISYPNKLDAKTAYDKGDIDEETYNAIVKANDLKIKPNWDSKLGGEVGIHGGGNSSDWTFGCIALSNDDIEILYDFVSLKTPVEIYE